MFRQTKTDTLAFKVDYSYNLFTRLLYDPQLTDFQA